MLTTPPSIKYFPSISIGEYNVGNAPLAKTACDKNPLFNTYVSIDSVKTKHYTISEFNLINVTKRDTLFFRTEFKGGDKGQDYFNLDLYHTIDKKKNNIVGIKKSEMKFKDYIWYLNEKSDDVYKK